MEVGVALCDVVDEVSARTSALVVWGSEDA